MKFTVERDAFDVALRAVLSRTKGGPDIPILSHVLVTARDKELSLLTHDTASCCSITIAAEVADEGAVAIPAMRLSQLVSGASIGSQIIIEDEGPQAKLRFGRAIYHLGTLPSDQFPEPLEPREPVSFELSAEAVALAFKVPACSIEISHSRPYLGGIHLHPQDGKLAAVATDGHTLVKEIIDCEVPAFNGVIVPKSALSEIVSTAGKGAVQIEIAENLIAVQSGSRRFVSKLIDGEYPGYTRIIPARAGSPFAVDAKALDAALVRLDAACDPDEMAVVKLSWGNEGDLEASLTSRSGTGVEVVECDHSGAPANFVGMQLPYIRKIIEAADGEVLNFYLQGPANPVRVENPRDEKFVGVIGPCKV